MSHKKNLSAEDLSKKFGVNVTEGDMTPDFDKDSKYLSKMADLSEFAQELEKKKPSMENAEKIETEQQPAEEKSFAELFEEKNKIVCTENNIPAAAAEKKKNGKLVEIADDMDFGKLFNSSSMKIIDKDAFSLPDKEYKPFEMDEEDIKSAGRKEFHGFEDFANAFGGRKKHSK